ncbi:hypothetical protein GJ744_006176 [Endocarpon pusillum]|uniref:Uncharacterized protein n=1 Tax=Endocarpon pusillum TaxID=364733 RepID=A0A8H7A441_9EURO|nr:hypothetical protein GJ744_006176 [Endocarpon pusillum]
MRKLTILTFVFITRSRYAASLVSVLKNWIITLLWVYLTTLILVVALVLMIATADGQLTFLMRIFAAMPVLLRGGEPDISQNRRWTAVFFFRAVSFDLASSLGHDWEVKAVLSQGRAYRTGYRDPDRLGDSESRNEAKDTCLYVQKGALMCYRAREKLDDYRRSWTGMAVVRFTFGLVGEVAWKQSLLSTSSSLRSCDHPIP